MSYIFREKISDRFRFLYGRKFYKFLSSRAPNVYLKHGDIISLNPTVLGSHEPHVEDFIRTSSQTHCDFFLDIGANIGITSVLVGNGFTRIDCVEPNPQVADILSVNLSLNFAKEQFHVHRIGLGSDNSMQKLRIPRDNFGGAQVIGNNPLKDVSEIDPRESTDVEIDVKDSVSWFSEVFRDYMSLNLKRGVIKIDVEGYEAIVLEGLLKALPSKLNAIVILENWFSTFDTLRFNSDKHDVSWFYFKRRKRGLASIPFKLLGLSGVYEDELAHLDASIVNPHDIVCFLDSSEGSK